MDMKKKLYLLILFLGVVVGVSGQNIAVKSNLLSDVALNVNAGLELRLARRWTLDLTGEYNAWTVNDHKWKHWLAQPEARYWFCDVFAKHFLGFHAIGGEYNIGNIKNNISFLGTDFSKLTDNRYQGWAVGGGVAYGYAFPLSHHWNFELEAGFGYVYTKFDKFECTTCGRKIGNGDHHYVGPTKAAVNLVYVF